MTTCETADRAPVRPWIPKQHSLPLLTSSKTNTETHAWLDKRGVEQDPGPANTSMVVIARPLRTGVPEFAGSKLSSIEQTASGPPPFTLRDRSDMLNLSQGQETFSGSPSRIPAGPPISKRRQMHRRGPKIFERMSPITEASFESLRPTCRTVEATTKLSAIAEYRRVDAIHSTSGLARSHTEATLKSCDVFKLDEADISPTEEYYEEDALTASDDEDLVHPGTKVDLKYARRQHENAFYLRSPLQVTEYKYLDAIEEEMRLEAHLNATEEEMRLEARRMTLARIEGEKQATDAKIEVLRDDHERLRLTFRSNKSAVDGGLQSQHILDSSSTARAERSRPLNNDVDFAEEPTLGKAKAVEFTKIVPATVKLVQIPSRREKLVSHVGINIPVPDTFALIESAKRSGENHSPTNVSFSTSGDILWFC